MSSNDKYQVLPGGEKYRCEFRFYSDKEVFAIHTKDEDRGIVKIWSREEGILDNDLFQKYIDTMYHLLKSRIVVEDGYVIDMIHKEV